ncbi:low-specificity L-threonine aldolase [Christensenellaceae bacterium OttesenSCG-928-M15]|nr:low-specificity L-threonine aldolase [Christensenellaceae bacterium OttesenSCG-928-M15]
MHYIDLRSDTVTIPTPAMREAMASAAVGDDVYRDDPTMNELEALAANMLGKEAGLFVPSGTMGNQLAIMAHTNRGDEVIASREAHIFVHEVGAPAVLSGVMLNLLEFENGIFDAKKIEAVIRPDDIHEPETTLICLENALSNGRVMDVSTMKEIYEMAKRHNLPVHMDGARVFNAAVALHVDVKELTRQVDTISCCLSKGLCAPVGAVLAGPYKFIERARKYRKLLGGGMRQAGILAAAGIIALKDMPSRLQEDHENARYLADELNKLDGISVDLSSVQVNMVWFSVDRSKEFVESIAGRLLEKGVKSNGPTDGKLRFVTHYGVSRENIDAAVAALKEVMRG